MQEICEDIWKLHNRGFWIVIPTNGFIKKDGKAVMGRGLALQANITFNRLAKNLGEMLLKHGNHVFSFPEYRLLTFPVKDNWRNNAILDLIEQSCKELKTIVHYNLGKIPNPIYIPKVGCGNGKLDWKDVKQILEQFLDERFEICDLK